MPNKKQTSKKVASLAAKLLKKDLLRKDEKSVAGSDLAQTKNTKGEKVEDQINVGLYIGNGPKPDNVNAQMFVDSSGKDVGVYIGDPATHNIGELIEKAITDNPTLATQLSKFLEELGRVKDQSETKTLLEKIRDFLGKNSSTLIGAASLLYNILSRDYTVN